MQSDRISPRATLQDLATLKRHGYETLRIDAGWLLLAPRDGWETELSHRALMIGEHGCLSPTQWEAVAEGLGRIAADAR
jgi:hypothetical protein